MLTRNQNNCLVSFWIGCIAMASHFMSSLMSSNYLKVITLHYQKSKLSTRLNCLPGFWTGSISIASPISVWLRASIPLGPRTFGDGFARGFPGLSPQASFWKTSIPRESRCFRDLLFRGVDWLLVYPLSLRVKNSSSFLSWFIRGWICLGERLFAPFIVCLGLGFSVGNRLISFALFFFLLFLILQTTNKTTIRPRMHASAMTT